MKFTFKEEADVLRGALHGLATLLSEEGRADVAGRCFDVLVATQARETDDDPRAPPWEDAPGALDLDVPGIVSIMVEVSCWLKQHPRACDRLRIECWGDHPWASPPGSRHIHVVIRDDTAVVEGANIVVARRAQ